MPPRATRSNEKSGLIDNSDAISHAHYMCCKVWQPQSGDDVDTVHRRGRIELNLPEALASTRAHKSHLQTGNYDGHARMYTHARMRARAGIYM